MRIELLALYAGPDQVMTVTSGLASVLGLLLIFWNKVVGIFFKVVRKFSRSGYACPRELPRTLLKALRKFRVRFLRKKVIVIGLDGLEPGIVEAMLERGELPNLAKIRASGSYSRLKTTYPAQTPVAWSSFVTGTNPGGHGIFDFICRDPQTYLPDVALTRFERPKNMLAQPRVVNRRQRRTAVADALGGRHSQHCFALSVYVPSGSIAGPDAGRSGRSRPARQSEQRHVLHAGQIGGRARKRTADFSRFRVQTLTTRVIGPRNTEDVTCSGYFLRSSRPGGQGSAQADDSNWRLAGTN